ncbi:MAG: hypothetical protein M1457_12920 [bacterium]|nr:hypothetical protein [bacterium]
MIAQSRTIAKGRHIREVTRLMNLYGGIASKWMKKNSLPFELEGRIYEIHWYEHPRMGRFELKQKEVSEP